MTKYIVRSKCSHKKIIWITNNVANSALNAKKETPLKPEKRTSSVPHSRIRTYPAKELEKRCRREKRV